MSAAFFKLWAFLTRQVPVCLRDHDGKLTNTVARKTPFGLRAKRWWPFNIRNVSLKEDGSIAEDCYVHEWKRI